MADPLLADYVNSLTDVHYDEVSTVRVGAHQDALIVLTKSGNGHTCVCKDCGSKMGVKKSSGPDVLDRAKQAIKKASGQ